MSDTESNPPRPTGGTTEPAASGASAAPARPAAEAAPRPKIGDSRPAPPVPAGGSGAGGPSPTGGSSGGSSGGQPGTGQSRSSRRRRRRRGGGGGGGQGGQGGQNASGSQNQSGSGKSGQGKGGQGKGGQNRSKGGQGGQNRSKGGQSKGGQGRSGEGRSAPTPVEAVLSDDTPVELDDETLERRRGRQRKGRAIGRYQMNVHVGSDATHIAILEGRSLVEHFVSRPSDDVSQIHGNIYVGRVENVLPGMEAAFIDIATPKNAVLYRSDVQYDPDDIESKGGDQPRIEDVLKARQLIVCQVTKNPIAHKGARLTQEVSLPGRFVVLVPNSRTFGISKRLPDNERKRLRQILDKVKPERHGLIVRTAAENITADEIERDVARLARQWEQIEALAAEQQRPGLIYREPEMAVRIIREEFNSEYRSVLIDDRALFDDMHDYVAAVAPALVDRVQFFDPDTESLPMFERFHVTEQLVKALDRKVWLPSGGSLIIEHTEALTVIDVNTGRNVGSSSLEETVFRNNLEAAEEIARQLRLRDIGGIIVIDFVDMEVKENRDKVVKAFRDALSRDKTRTQVFNISELGLVEMTRKRIGEGLLESVADRCDHCDGRGLLLPDELVG
ncbi:MAG TPA: Rne/Rng family ribonuclease [Microthrixaceae bacterium]|nr:Rne/Rng family ribonuclease [Microthrixaceae bacterium]